MGAFRKKTKAASAEPLIDGGVAKSRAEQASENVEATTGEPIKDNDPTTPSSSPSSTIKTGSFSPSEASLNASIDSSVRREGVVMPGEILLTYCENGEAPSQPEQPRPHRLRYPPLKLTACQISMTATSRRELTASMRKGRGRRTAAAPCRPFHRLELSYYQHVTSKQPA